MASMCPTEQGATRAQAAVAFPLSTERGFLMAENDTEVAPLTRKQAIPKIIQDESPEGEDESFKPSDDGASSIHKATWGASEVAAWRNPASTGSGTEFVAASGPEDESSKALLKDLNELFALKNKFTVSDKIGKKVVGTNIEQPDGVLTREELFFEATQALQWNPESATAEKHAFKNFGRLSGGDKSISEKDLDDAIRGNLADLILESAVSGKFSPEVRGALAQWAHKMSNPKDAKALQEELNTALEGTGLHAKLEHTTRKNYLGEEYSLSTITMLNQNQVLDKFSLVSPYAANRSLLGGKALASRDMLLDNVDPDKTYSPEITKDMQDLRALDILMDSRLMGEGGITFQEAAKSEKSYPEQEHAHRFLQGNFAKLAMRDEDGSSVSKKDIRLAMEESLSSLIRKHLSRDGSKRNALIEGFVQDALRDENIGNSETFTKTLNAALDKYGYKATLSDKYHPQGRITLPIERKLTIEDKLGPTTPKEIKVMLPNPNLLEGQQKSTQPSRDSYDPRPKGNANPRVLGRTPA